jgi:hypothetical protein
MFRNDVRTGPVSDAVAKLWRVNRANAETKSAAISYFPKAEGSQSAPVAEPEAGTAPETTSATGSPAVGASAPINVPLPPPRPRDIARPATPLRPERLATTGLAR